MLQILNYFVGTELAVLEYNEAKDTQIWITPASQGQFLTSVVKFKSFFRNKEYFGKEYTFADSFSSNFFKKSVIDSILLLLAFLPKCCIARTLLDLSPRMIIHVGQTWADYRVVRVRNEVGWYAKNLYQHLPGVLQTLVFLGLVMSLLCLRVRN